MTNRPNDPSQDAIRLDPASFKQLQANQSKQAEAFGKRMAARAQAEQDPEQAALAQSLAEAAGRHSSWLQGKTDYHGNPIN